jgi:Imidazolonepropionase and related amidohydrolases
VELDVDEMRAAIDEGKKHEMIGVAHCHSKQGMLNALEAGAISIEHATFVDKEVVEVMLEKKAYVVPTFSPYVLIDRHGLENGVSAYMCRMAGEICAYKNEHFRQVHESGVPIAFGRDAGAPFVRHGKYVLEMQAMEKCGMSRRAVIQSATENAAKLLGLWDDVGSLDAGKFADMVVLDADPANDLAAFESVAMVFKEGVRVR